MQVHGIDTCSAVDPVGLIKARNGSEAKSRRWVLVTGLAPPSRLGVFNNNLENGYRAFAERYFRCKVGDDYLSALPTSNEEWCNDPYMREFCELTCRHLNLAPILSCDEVVNQYNGTKRRVYARANEQYSRVGITREDAVLRSFVKFEKCALDKAPRVINPRSPVYNLFLGRWLKKNEHAYFDALASSYDQEVVVMKGFDVRRTAELIEGLWHETPHPVAIGGDASKFDMHVSKQALFYEHLFYILPYCSSYGEAKQLYARVISESRKCKSPPGWYSDREQLCWTLAQQLENVGKAYFVDGVLKFKMSGTRASGDLNTSLGNCIIMSAMTYAWSKRSKVPVKLVNNGDDCQYIIEARHESAWRGGFNEFYERKGFRMVLEETVDELENLEFCQAKPVRTADGIKMVRNPRTLVTKASMCLLPIGDNIRLLRKWLMAVGVAEGSLSQGVPVLQAFAAALRRNGRRCSRKFISNTIDRSGRFYGLQVDTRVVEITPAARVSFCTAFGILPHEQILLEEHYSTWRMSDRFGCDVASWEALDRDSVRTADAMHLYSE